MVCHLEVLFLDSSSSQQKLLSAKFPHGTVWREWTLFYQGLKIQQGEWQEGDILSCSASSARPHSKLHFLAPGTPDLHKTLLLGSTPPGPGSPKALFSFGNQFLVPNLGLSEVRPCPCTEGWYPPSWPKGLVLYPNQCRFPDKRWQLGTTRGSQPPHQWQPGWDGSFLPGVAQPSQPSELMGPAARRAGSWADAGLA